MAEKELSCKPEYKVTPIWVLRENKNVIKTNSFRKADIKPTIIHVTDLQSEKKQRYNRPF